MCTPDVHFVHSHIFPVSGPWVKSKWCGTLSYFLPCMSVGFLAKCYIKMRSKNFWNMSAVSMSTFYWTVSMVFMSVPTPNCVYSVLSMLVLNCCYDVHVSTSRELCLQCSYHYQFETVSTMSMSVLVLNCVYSVHVSTSIELCLQCPCQY